MSSALPSLPPPPHPTPNPIPPPHTLQLANAAMSSNQAQMQKQQVGGAWSGSQDFRPFPSPPSSPWRISLERQGWVHLAASSAAYRAWPAACLAAAHDCCVQGGMRLGDGYVVAGSSNTPPLFRSKLLAVSGCAH
ncbi:hypothetical protein V8C86DRAFT_3026624 [Haematococcus lacustris]